MVQVGGTPFGPFSPSVRLTFAQTDPARRFRLYGYIERTLRRLTSLFRTYAVQRPPPSVF